MGGVEVSVVDGQFMKTTKLSETKGEDGGRPLLGNEISRVH